MDNKKGLKHKIHNILKTRKFSMTIGGGNNVKSLRKRISVLLAFFLIILLIVSFIALPVSAAGSYEIGDNESLFDLQAKLDDPAYDTVIWNSNIPDPPGHITITIPAGKTFIIKGSSTCSISSNGMTLVVNGTFILEENSKVQHHPQSRILGITNNGTIINNGTLEANVTNNGSYSGSDTVRGTITGPNVYDVTFDENYTSAPTTLVNVYDTTVGTTLMPIKPARIGYTFMGWNTAADGSGTTFDNATLLGTLGSKTPTVYAQWLSQACDITSFTLPNQVGTTTIGSTNISVTVPHGTDVTALFPTITVSDGATVSPASGAAVNFTNPVTYTVTAADGTTKQYIVTVTVGVQATYAVTVTNGTGSGSYPQGATVNITADTPPAGQVFDKWTSSSGVTFANENMAITSFTMPAKAVSIAATYKDTPLIPVTKHTITLGASGDGTVTGGGTFDENSNITVTARPNAGNSFVNWTENDVGVSTSSSYSFAVTADRTLVANFKADGLTPPTPTPSYGGRSSSSGGSSKADTSPVFARAFTIADATKLFGAALATKPEGQATLSFRAQNFTSVDKSVFAELAALAKKNGVTLTVHFDTVVGKAVTYRVSVNPALIATNLDLTAKIVGGKLTMPKFSPAAEVAVKMPAGLTLENLEITENGKEITNAKPWLDKNGYLHFTTTGGEIVLSNKTI